MFKEIQELRELCEVEIKNLRREILMLRGNIFLRWDAKGYIQKAEAKVEMLHELLVKLETLAEQITPVVTDIKNIVGLQIKEK
ncbi:hypothetical protein [Desulforamulus aquiferis]|uniref:Uncharacterized protein n=1 Tax=Desulforamulus aquiferis TaxID=1397668 RepID=A0AAW7ZBU6_9FIRM|nr:hypothetical protein [Desulforamulus aquiferis]MDO7786700.1 hypothetical protein [Desulforamulus aquiferis]RYD06892.1 hypothetical protein N752_01830 [Desulforamulus aquiferis]